MPLNSCPEADNARRLLFLGASDTMTPARCLSMAANMTGYELNYIAIQQGTKCYGANDLMLQQLSYINDTACTARCSNGQQCGGPPCVQSVYMIGAPRLLQQHVHGSSEPAAAAAAGAFTPPGRCVC